VEGLGDRVHLRTARRFGATKEDTAVQFGIEAAEVEAADNPPMIFCSASTRLISSGEWTPVAATNSLKYGPVNRRHSLPPK